MLEAVQEIVRPIEKPQNNRLNNIGDQVDSLGKKFLIKKINKHLGDWRIDKKDSPEDSKDAQRSLEFHKGGEKERLNVVYEKSKGQKGSGWELREFTYTLSDGRTKIILMKNEQGNWQVGRLNSREKRAGKDELSFKEQVKLENFMFKFRRDRIVNGIVDTVDPDEIFRYVVPVALTVGVAGHAALTRFGQPINATTISQAFLNRPTVGAPLPDIPDSKNKTLNKTEKPAPLMVGFSSLESKNTLLEQAFLAGRTDILTNNHNNEQTAIKEIGTLDTLEMASGFFDRSVAFKNGDQEAAAIRQTLLDLKDDSGQALYQQPPGTLRLPESIDRVINNLNGKKFPYSQEDVYTFIQTLMNFNGGQLVTPADVMRQNGNYGGGGIGGSSLYQAFAVNEQLFNNKGELKGNWLLLNSNPGDLLATDEGADSLSTTIIRTRSTKNGTDFSTMVWKYDEQTGDSTIENLTSSQLPDQTITFGKK